MKTSISILLFVLYSIAAFSQDLSDNLDDCSTWAIYYNQSFDPTQSPHPVECNNSELVMFRTTSYYAYHYRNYSFEAGHRYIIKIKYRRSGTSRTEFWFYPQNGNALIKRAFQNDATWSGTDVAIYYPSVSSSNFMMYYKDDCFSGCSPPFDYLYVDKITIDEDFCTGPNATLSKINNCSTRILTAPAGGSWYNWYQRWSGQTAWSLVPNQIHIVNNDGTANNSFHPFYGTKDYYAEYIDANGCLIKTDPITVYEAPNTPIISPSGPLTVCAGTTVTLTSSEAPAYQWSTGETTRSIIVSASGNYNVKVFTEDGCTNFYPATPVQVTVNPNPYPSITGSSSFCGSPVTLSAENASSYLWSTGATTQSITATGGGNYSVTVTNQFGCSATSSAFTVTDNRPSATMIPTAVFNTCSPTGTLVASSGSAYQWYRNGVAITNTTQNFNVTQGGSYYVAVTNPAGCSGVTLSTGQYTIENLISLTAANKTTCAGNGVTLTGTPTGGTWSGPGVNGSTFYSATTGTFAVTYTYSSGGCTQSTPAMITVNPGVVITSFEGTGPVCPGNSYTYRANVSGSGYTYQWTKPSGWTVQSQSGNQITYNVPASNPNYGAVGVTVSKNGCSDSDGITVYPGSCGSGSFSYSYSVSPNPANNELTLTTEEASEQPTPIVIYDQFGKIIKTVMLKPGEQRKTIETGELSSGFYWIQIGTKGKPVQKKVIVLHER